MTATPIYRTGGVGVAWRETGGEVVVLDLARSVYFGLNPTAAMLWKLLVGGATRDQLIAALLAGGADDPVKARGDAAAFLAQLRSADLLLADAPG